MTWLISLVGARAAKPVLYVLAVLIALGLVFTLARCTRPDNAVVEQATQTTRSGEAIANAAGAAVLTIDNRAVTERDIDTATAVITENIDNAQNYDAVRAAVVAGVCRQASHRNDPACAMR